MNLKPRMRVALAFLIVLIAGVAIGRYTASPSGDAPAASAPSFAAATPTVWTCSMHPQIQQPDPGDCPICAMDLIPLTDDGSGDLGPRAMKMSESALALADVQTTEVKRALPAVEVRLVGTLERDITRVRSLTARFPARIERLFVNYDGVTVNTGEHLGVVYSPELLTAQRELLTAHRADPNGTLARAAREKLRLWDLLPDQIDAILAGGLASDRFELRSPVSGVVVEKAVKEGDYVQTGQPLFTIADLGNLWLVLSAYESDLPWLRYGQSVEFSVEAYPGETFTGTIAFIEPELDRRTRTVSVRVNVPNPDGRLKPGMFARGLVAAQLAGNGRVYVENLAGKWISPMHPEIVKDAPGSCDVCGMPLVTAESLGFAAQADVDSKDAPLVVPASAVLRTGKRAVVYVRRTDMDEAVFEGREIVLGPRAGDVFMVESGLAEGELVATRGAFKIDSALQIQAKPSMMSIESGEVVEPVRIEIPNELATTLLPPYFTLVAAMAADDLDGTRAALRALMEQTGHDGPLADLIHTMLAGEDLEAMRRPHLEILSNALIAAVRANPHAFTGDVFEMHCPMVYGDTGASWLQPDDRLLNPYFGAMMLRCGDVVENLTQNADQHDGHEQH